MIRFLFLIGLFVNLVSFSPPQPTLINPSSDNLFHKGTIFEYDLKTETDSGLISTEKRFYLVDSVFRDGKLIIANIQYCYKTEDGKFIKLLNYEARRDSFGVKIDIGHLLYLSSKDTNSDFAAHNVMVLYKDSMRPGQTYPGEKRKVTVQGGDINTTHTYKSGAVNTGNGQTVPVYNSQESSAHIPTQTIVYNIGSRTVVAKESISVVAGNFNCYRIKFSCGEGEELIQMMDWYQPGQGFIKRRIIYPDGKKLTLELTSITRPD